MLEGGGVDLHAKFRLVLLTIVLLVLSLPSVLAYKLDLGARPLGMGGTFVAVADDINALGWNVAGLAYQKQGALLVSRENLYGLEIPLDFLTVTIPSKKFGTLGISLSSMRVDTNLAGYEESEIRAGWAQNYAIRSYDGLPNWCGLGILIRGTKVQAFGDRDANGFNLSLEVGYLQQYSSRIQLGMVLKCEDLYSKWEITNSEQNLPSSAKKAVSIDLGIGIKTGQNGLIALDLRNLGGLRFVACGYEYKVSQGVSVRSGLSGSGFSAGVSFKQGAWELDYAFLPNAIGNANKMNLIYNF